MKSFTQFLIEFDSIKDNIYFYTRGVSNSLSKCSIDEFDSIPSDCNHISTDIVYRKIILSDSQLTKLKSGKIIKLSGDSIFSSWSTSLESAKKFRSKKNGNEIIIKKSINKSDVLLNINDYYEKVIKERYFYTHENEILVKNSDHFINISLEDVIKW